MSYSESLEKCSKIWFFGPLKKRQAVFNWLCFFISADFRTCSFRKNYFHPNGNLLAFWLVYSPRQSILNEFTGGSNAGWRFTVLSLASELFIGIVEVGSLMGTGLSFGTTEIGSVLMTLSASGDECFLDLDFLLLDSFFGFSDFLESVSFDLDLERFSAFSDFFSDLSFSDFFDFFLDIFAVLSLFSLLCCFVFFWKVWRLAKTDYTFILPWKKVFFLWIFQSVNIC